MYHNKSDNKLIELAKEGNSSAFAELYARHMPHVTDYLTKLLGSQIDAEDLSSVVALKMMEKINQFDHDNFRGWLIVIARNAARDMFRRKIAIPVEHIPETATDELSTLDKIIMIDDNKRFIESIATLSSDQRKVMYLKMIEGMTNKQVGDRIGKTEGAVKSLQHRATQQMQLFDPVLI